MRHKEDNEERTGVEGRNGMEWKGPRNGGRNGWKEWNGMEWNGMEEHQINSNIQ